MFRSDAQRTRACRALLATRGLERYWTAAGPADAAVAILQGEADPLSHGESLLVRATLAFWNCHNPVLFGELLGTLDAAAARAAFTLAIAVTESADAIDAWLATHEATSARVTS